MNYGCHLAGFTYGHRVGVGHLSLAAWAWRGSRLGTGSQGPRKRVRSPFFAWGGRELRVRILSVIHKVGFSFRSFPPSVSWAGELGVGGDISPKSPFSTYLVSCGCFV